MTASTSSATSTPPRTFAQLQEIYQQPLFDLISQAREAYLRHWKKNEVQLCTLLNIKTGGCSEDCKYCAQSSHYSTTVEREQQLPAEEIIAAAQRARAQGSTRFCMGAAWKGVKAGDPKFDSVLTAVRGVSALGLEVCVTLGALDESAAQQLKEAGLKAYNHNIDTSPEYYPQVVTTHTFADRLNTIQHVQDAGLSLCCGGILGMGESIPDRLRMLEVLVNFNPPPESVPINCLHTIPGTPMEEQTPLDTFDLVRMIATTRIALPASRVRLSAGRKALSREAQALCFFAGANSIFYGDKLLTTPNPDSNSDLRLLRDLGLDTERPFEGEQPLETLCADKVDKAEHGTCGNGHHGSCGHNH